MKFTPNKNLLCLLLCIASCQFALAQKGKLIDKKATAESKALYKNLHKLAAKHTLFGHQHATEYGHGWSGGADSNRSDVKSVTGSHPAVVGFDFNALFGRNEAGTERSTTALRKLVTNTYNRGGVVTIAWHFSNPVSATNFYWNDSTASPAVKHIIPGGSHHDKYKQILGTVARFALSCKGADGTLAPMIFGPFTSLTATGFGGVQAIAHRTNLFRFGVLPSAICGIV